VKSKLAFWNWLNKKWQCKKLHCHSGVHTNRCFTPRNPLQIPKGKPNGNALLPGKP
jgi:hypothetical protein